MVDDKIPASSYFSGSKDCCNFCVDAGGDNNGFVILDSSISKKGHKYPVIRKRRSCAFGVGGGAYNYISYKYGYPRKENLRKKEREKRDHTYLLGCKTQKSSSSTAGTLLEPSLSDACFSKSNKRFMDIYAKKRQILSPENEARTMVDIGKNLGLRLKKDEDVTFMSFIQALMKEREDQW